MNKKLFLNSTKLTARSIVTFSLRDCAFIFQCLFGLLSLIAINNNTHAFENILNKREFKDIFQQETKLRANLSRLKKNLKIVEGENRMQVFEALAQDLPWTANSLHDASIIFQHTNTEMELLDNEEYRSQEMHLLTFFLLREEIRLSGKEMSTLLGPYRYLSISGLPKNLEVTWTQDPTSKKMLIDENDITDSERLEKGFPFKLRQKNENTFTQKRLTFKRSDKRENETGQLYLADQQTRSLFKKDEMIFNRYIERVGDAQRRARLYEMMAEDVLWSGEDLYFAANILQNSPSVISLKGNGKFQLQENHLLAFFFARQAHFLGYKTATSLMIESLNQYLLVSRMPKSFQLKHSKNDNGTVCQSDPHVSVELWGKYEFPFHLGKALRNFCP